MDIMDQGIDVRKRISLREVFKVYESLKNEKFVFCGWIRDMRKT